MNDKTQFSKTWFIQVIIFSMVFIFLAFVLPAHLAPKEFSYQLDLYSSQTFELSVGDTLDTHSLTQEIMAWSCHPFTLALPSNETLVAQNSEGATNAKCSDIWYLDDQVEGLYTVKNGSDIYLSIQGQGEITISYRIYLLYRILFGVLFVLIGIAIRVAVDLVRTLYVHYTYK